MGDRWIDYQDIDAIVPAILNPKNHDWDALNASMDLHDFTEPVLVDERTGRLVSGHGRVEALQKRRASGQAPPEGVSVVDGSWLLPVVRGWSSKDDAHAASALLGANRITEAGGWREDEVAALLSRLEEVDPALVLAAGFDEEAISEAMRDADEGRIADVDDGDDWETVTLRLPPDVALQFRAALDVMGGPESEAVRRLVETATSEPPPPF